MDTFALNEDLFALNEDDRFSIMEKYFSEKGPVFHQFESYEYMLEVLFQKIVDETPSLYIEVKNIKYKATFGQIYVEKPLVFPQEARCRNITYDSPVFVDIKEEFWELDEKTETYEKTNDIEHKKILLMKVPTMVRSSKCNLYGLSMDECVKEGECFNDPGGYFIINGKERALVCQERLNYNQVYVFESNDDKSNYVADIRSMSEETGHSILLQARMNKDHKNICFSLPYMSKEVYAGTVFKSLGFNSQDIIKFVNPVSKEEHKIVDRMIRESIEYTNKEKAIKYISKASIHKVEDDEERRIIYTQQVIENEMFPHMGISTPLEKAILLGDMLNKLIRVSLRIRIQDDRDNVSLKRIEGPGVLIADLFRMCMKRYSDTLKKNLEKRQDIITAMARTNNITSSLKHVFSTGNWAVQKNSYVRTGVSQIMSRLTYPATISHLRRIIIPIGKEGKNVKIRQIHPTQAFFVDIIESPEGKSIGIVKNLALLSNISTGCNSILVKGIVEKCENITPCQNFFERDDWSKVYINGALVGLTHNADGLYKELLRLRNVCVFGNQVSFYHEKDDKEIRILCDHGRFMRPVLRVKDNKVCLTKKQLEMTWTEFMEEEYVQYIDSNEVENSLIAMNPDDLQKYGETTQYDYCEIHPSAMLGVCSATIPYPEHNQSPRLVYQSSMVKQALGVYSLAFRQRFDTITHVMHYPQKPLVTTKYDKMLKYDEMLTGCNPVVAIMTYGGFNQEDSVMLNRASIDRGMFVHTCYKTVMCEENKKTNCSFERIEKPPPKAQNKSMDYSKLDENGIVRRGTPITKGDIIIGKTLTKVQKDEEEEKNDLSLAVSFGEEGVVDEIWEGLNEEGYRMVKVRIRQLRTPEVGDKFASRSSQKGVCGLLLDQEDMPFTSQGITPDMLINPHCFTGENQVSLYNGLSRKIKDLSEKESVWTYDYENNGLTSRKNLGMEWKGYRPVSKLTFEDGRTIRCTPDHKFHVLTEEGVKQVEAKDLSLNEDKIIMGLDGVEDVNYQDEDGWELDTKHFTFSCKNREERDKAMAFSRILGYLLTDGCVFKNKESETFKCPIHFGHSIDADICIKDIELITGKPPKVSFNGNKSNTSKTYIVYLPYELSQSIGLMEGVSNGRRTRQDSNWPDFLYTCPKSVLREFLAGLFGGDGHAPYIQGRKGSQPVGVKFSKSIHEDFKESFETKMKNLCDLLKKFEVDAVIERVREYRNGPENELFYSYYINVRDSLVFCQKIGVRYCTEKMSRLCLYKSYEEFQERVKAQSELIMEMIDDYTYNKKMTKAKALEKAREDFLKDNVCLNKYYSLSSLTQIGNRRKANRSSEVLHLSYKYFPTFIEYLENIGCLEWFSKSEYIVKREVPVLPTFHMKLLKYKEEGEDDVYCIGVDQFHNFVCQGAIVLNCMPSRMTLSQLTETLLGKTVSLAGRIGDSTAFSEASINPTEKIFNELKQLGYERHGNERLYCGYTGEMLEAEIFIGPTYYQRLKHLVKDKIHCLTLDHEVLTLDGWKPIGDITVNDKVATLSNNSLEYQCPTHTWKYDDYEGEMYHIKNQSVDLSVTAKHRMWVSKLKGPRGGVEWSNYDFEEAKDIVGKHRKYKKDAEWNKPDYQFILPSSVKKGVQTNEKYMDMNSFLIFFGIWYAEGWASGHDRYGRIAISVNKQRVKDALFPALEKLGIETIFDEKAQKLYVSDNQLYHYMKPLSVGAPQKKMPSWVFELSLTQTRLLIESMVLGDGFYMKNNRFAYYSSSKDIADQVQQLCLHAGWASIISTHFKAGEQKVYINDREVVNHHDLYRISIIKSKLNPAVNHSHVHTQKVQEEKFGIEKCPVMCITVPNEVFYVRRNGKAVWTGNSRSRGNVTMMHHQPSEGRSRDGGLRTGEMERDSLISHGGSAFIQETFFDMSDVYQVNVCNECGAIVSSAKECRVCRRGDITRANIPYCSKLLLQELMAMNVKIQIGTV